MIPAELAKKIRYIEIYTSKAVNDVLAGEYESVFKGQGMELNDKIDTTERYLRLTINTNIVDSSKDLEMIEWIQSYFKTKTPYSAEVQGQTDHRFAFRTSGRWYCRADGAGRGPVAGAFHPFVFYF